MVLLFEWEGAGWRLLGLGARRERVRLWCCDEMLMPYPSGLQISFSDSTHLEVSSANDGWDEHTA